MKTSTSQVLCPVLLVKGEKFMMMMLAIGGQGVAEVFFWYSVNANHVLIWTPDNCSAALHAPSTYMTNLYRQFLLPIPKNSSLIFPEQNLQKKM
jgi:hypothetical protein